MTKRIPLRLGLPRLDCSPPAPPVLCSWRLVALLASDQMRLLQRGDAGHRPRCHLLYCLHGTRHDAGCSLIYLCAC